MKKSQPNKLRLFYDVFLLILMILTIVLVLSMVFSPVHTSFDKAKSFMSFTTALFILLEILSFYYIYSLVSMFSSKDFWVDRMSWAILTSAIIPGISPLLFYLLVFRKKL